MISFNRPIRASVENVERYVLAAMALHNYLRQTNNASYTPNGFVDSENNNGSIRLGEWRNNVSGNANGLVDIRPIRGSINREEFVQMREDLEEYFCSEEGSVTWQLDYVRRTYKN